MDIRKQLDDLFRIISPEVREEILNASAVHEFTAGTEILREGQYIKVIPIILDGLVKVFTRNDDKELLLYYIQPSESCIMTFAACLRNEQSKIFAVCEENTTALLLPADKLNTWIKKFPEINSLFYNQYDLRYSDLLDTIHQLVFEKMDERLLAYLKEKVKVTNKNPVKISHRQIASELGTAREVVSRILKKLENDGKVAQDSGNIKIL